MLINDPYKLNLRTSIRLNSDTDNKLREIIKKYPNKYESLSHLLRCAIQTHYREMVVNGEKQTPNGF